MEIEPEELEKHYEVQQEINGKLDDLKTKMDNHLEHEHSRLDNRLDTIDSAISGLRKKIDKIDPASQKFVAVVGAFSMIIYLAVILIFR